MPIPPVTTFISVSSTINLHPAAAEVGIWSRPVSTGFVAHAVAGIDANIVLSVQANLGLSVPAPSSLYSFGRPASTTASFRPSVSLTMGTTHYLNVSARLGVAPTLAEVYVVPIVVSVSAGFGLHPAAVEYVNPIRLSVYAGLNFHPAYALVDPYGLAVGLDLRPVVTAYVNPIRLSVSSGFGLRPGFALDDDRKISLAVSAGLGLRPATAPVANRIFNLSVSAGMGFAPAPGATDNRRYSESVSSSLGVMPRAVLATSRQLAVSASASLVVSAGVPSLAVHSLYQLQVLAGLNLSASAATGHGRLVAVSSALALAPSASSPRSRSLGVLAALALTPSVAAPRAWTASVSAGLGLHPAAVLSHQIVPCSVSAGLGLQPAAVAVATTLRMAVGLGLSCGLVVQHVPPGLASGPGEVLYSGLSGAWPFTYAETPQGVVLIANGVDPMLRWQMGRADVAGVQPPATAPAATASGLGTITGLRYLFVRFIDSHGNPSNLSPAGVVQCGSEQSIDDIAYDAASGLVALRVPNHGLKGNQQVILRGITGLPMNGTFGVTVLDPDHFLVQDLVVTSGSWMGGGSVLTGSLALTYSAIPQPTQPKVASIQLLRNLEGNLDVLFVEAAINPGVLAFAGGLPDDRLCQGQAVVWRGDDGTPLGMRHAVPPSNRPYLVNYMGRIFAAGDVTITGGNAQVTNGSTAIRGWGTQWPASLGNRSIYVKGASASYAISSLDPTTQLMVISTPFSGSTSLFTAYSVRSSPGDRKLIQWSEPDNPEAWPPWNALAIPEDNDEVTGLFVRGTYLYIAERRHLWRFQFSGDPATTGHVFLQAQRGAINHRCIADADDATFIMDEVGIYAFDGDGSAPIDQDVQAIFWGDGLSPTWEIDWAADRTLWHAAVDRLRTTVRWFVAVAGRPGLEQALCYNYRSPRWWWETYPVAVTGSCVGTLAASSSPAPASGIRRALAGAEARTVLVLGQGQLDIAPGTGTIRGTLTAASSTSLADATAAFSQASVGAPLAMVTGVAAGQASLIADTTTTTLDVVDPFDPPPAPGDIYQVGGIPWEWRGGWLDVEDEEADTTRDLVVAYRTLANPTDLLVQLYFDHADTPMDFGYQDTGLVADGITTTPGQPQMVVDMSNTNGVPGYRAYRMARHSQAYASSDRYIQFHLSGVQATESVRVYQVSLRGVDQEGV